jgi:hypothetical protein
MSSKRSFVAETAHTKSKGSKMAGCPAEIDIGGMIYSTMMNRK